MNTVYGFMKAGIYKTGLVIGADCLSKLTDWSDRGTCVLFGDAAGAAVVRAEEGGLVHMTMGSDGVTRDRCFPVWPGPRGILSTAGRRR